MDVQNAPPAQVIAGDSLLWNALPFSPATPAPDWSVVLHIAEQKGGAHLLIDGRAVGDQWQFSATSAQTATMPAGEYGWAVIATADETGERLTLARGHMDLLPDPLGGGDRRSSAARILAAIEATIEGRATKDAYAYAIEGRSITRTPIADLLRLRAIYRRELAAERGERSGGVHYRRVAMT